MRGTAARAGWPAARLASAGALIVGLVIVAALAAPLLATTDPIEQDLSVALQAAVLADGRLGFAIRSAPTTSAETSTRAWSTAPRSR